MEQRGEAVFIDYDQNARDRTITSAYSARRTPRATVSTPPTWQELPDPAWHTPERRTRRRDRGWNMRVHQQICGQPDAPVRSI